MSKLTYDSDNLQLKIEDESYRLDVHAEANYWWTPGTMYRSNGDPGDPPDEEVEIERIAAHWFLTDKDGNEKKVKATEKMLDELYDYLSEMDIENWRMEGPGDF